MKALVLIYDDSHGAAIWEQFKLTALAEFRQARGLPPVPNCGPWRHVADLRIVEGTAAKAELAQMDLFEVTA